MQKNNRKYFIFLWLFLASFAMIALYHAQHNDIFVDEYISYKIIGELSYQEIFAGYDVHPPLYMLLTKALPHDSIYSLRLYSIFIMLAVLLSIFYVYAKLFNIKDAVIVTVIIGLSQTMMYYGTQARMYPLLILFSVWIFYYVIRGTYVPAMIFLSLSCLTHYYAFFMFIPVIIVMLLRKEYGISLTTFVVGFTIFFCMVPYMLNQFYGDNPYMIPPPTDYVSMNTLMSMFVFPFMIPSSVSGVTISIFAIALIMIIFVLLFFIRIEKGDYITIYSCISLVTMLLIFFLAYFYNIPYHHRYMLMFAFPYFMLLYRSAMHIDNASLHIDMAVFFILLSILFISNEFITMETKMQVLSTGIKCPANILHETPFSYMPMSVYLPECSHYLAKEEDGFWKDVDYRTLYASPDSVNNMGVSYDYYIYYPDTTRQEALKGYLANSPFVVMIAVNSE